MFETIQLDTRLRVVSWSQGAERFFTAPLQTSQLVTQCLPALSGLEEILHKIQVGHIPQYHADNLVLALADGSTSYYSITVVGLFGKTKRSQGLVCLLADSTARTIYAQELTQQRNELSILRDQLEEQNASLSELNSLKSAFLSIASHEMRSPLANVRGYLDLLLEEVAGPITPRQKLFLDIIGTSINRMLSLANDLLDIERLESGQMRLDLSDFNLPVLARVVCGNFELDLEQRQIEIVIADEPHDLRVRADISRIEQVLTNLISNAIKYSPPGGQVRFSFEEQSDFIVTHIADHGIGISQDDQTKLFQRFFRASNADEQAHGNGLGLSIVQAIVERHGGQIWLKSELGQGSTFSFSLPKPTKLES